MRQLDVEFSLALNNRTGKYFALRDMIDGQGERIHSVRYWRLSLSTTPSGLFARILGRLMSLEVQDRMRSGIFSRVVPPLKVDRPVLFTDPLQTLLYDLKPTDVVVVHDMGPITSPRFYAPGVEAAYHRIFSDMARVRPGLVFVSEATRDAFAERYGRGFRTAAVIYNPVRVETLAGEEAAPAGVARPFLLCVGAVGARKNQAGAVRGFQLAGLGERGFQLVICGGPEPGFEDVATEAAKTPGARLIGYADESELRWLYRHATGFVLASWLEGFGVPAAEAIERDLLPVLSREPALQEVAGDSAVYVEAGDDASIAAGLLTLVQMPDAERAQRLAKAKAGLVRFDAERVREAWTRFFDQLLSAA